MTKSILISALCFLGLAAYSDVELVKDGKAVSEIVVSENPPAGVQTAAEELQKYIEKISGAKIQIVNKVSGDIGNQIYVGESDYTKKLGVKLDDIKYDGFKIIAEKNHIVIAGREIYNHEVFAKFKDEPDRQKAWEKFTGEKWRFPPIYDYRDFNTDCKIHLNDGTGTLYGVYDFLEQFGFRWYMPVKDIGTVIPSQKDLAVKDQNVKKEPEFSMRLMSDPAVGKNKEEFLWFKSMRVGAAKFIPIYHSISCLYEKYPKEVPQEYFGVVNGKVDYNIPRLTDKLLRANMVKFLETVDKGFPNLEYSCIGQPDGWSVMDSKDAEAGWDKIAERGQAGRFSDYYWDFIMDVRKRYMEKYPDRKFTAFAYNGTKRVPASVDKIPENVTVAFCQTAPLWNQPQGANDLTLREEWLSKMSGKNQLLIWEYYLDHAPIRSTPTLPVIFTPNMKKSFDGLYGRAEGFTVEIPWSTANEIKENKDRRMRRPGLNHLMIYLHNKLCWDRNLDVNAVLNEYYELFFGPAKTEMKEFYGFAEEVWMRPDSRMITGNSGFLKPADVDRFFEILNRAKAKAGDSVYGKRIAFIEKEMEPLRSIFDKLKRTGPNLRCYGTKDPMKIDGDLNKDFWQKIDNSYVNVFIPLKNLITGEVPDHVATNVSFRWSGNNLVIGIECVEPKMNKLNEGCKDRDSLSICSDDFVQINIETPNGMRPMIAVNPAGTVYDSCVTSNVADLPEFYKVPAVAVKKYADKWTVEIQIDASALEFERPSPNYPWGINICRQRMAGNTPEFYTLVPGGKDFKPSIYMGNLMMNR